MAGVVICRDRQVHTAGCQVIPSEGPNHWEIAHTGLFGGFVGTGSDVQNTSSLAGSGAAACCVEGMNVMQECDATPSLADSLTYC